MSDAGKVQVNSTDYDAIVVEFCYGEFMTASGVETRWAVPAWEEWGYADLAGPFATIEQAQAAVDAYREVMGA